MIYLEKSESLLRKFGRKVRRVSLMHLCRFDALQCFYLSVLKIQTPLFCVEILIKIVSKRNGCNTHSVVDTFPIKVRRK